MNRPFSSPFSRIAAASLVVALAGCELLKHNQEALTIINNRALGMQVGAFFDRYGRPSSRSDTVGGGTSYDWISPVPYAAPGPEGLDERVCKLRLTADARGRIDAVQIRYDAQGRKSTSRCGEIFAAG